MQPSDAMPALRTGGAGFRLHLPFFLARSLLTLSLLAWRCPPWRAAAGRASAVGSALDPNVARRLALTVEGAFSAADCDRIITSSRRLPPHQGNVGEDQQTNYRQRTVVLKWLRPRHGVGSFEWIYRAVTRAVEKANRDVWGFRRLGAPEDFELAQCVAHTPGRQPDRPTDRPSIHLWR